MGKQSPSNHGEGNPEAADRFNTPDLVAPRGTEGRMSEGPGLFRENEDGFGFANVRLRGPQNRGEPWIS
jgi:hypothetical protein